MYNIKEMSKRVRHLLGEPTVTVELQEETMSSLLSISINQWYMLSELSKLSLDKLNTIEARWVESYFQALCKENLGRIYGKFNGNIQVPGFEASLNYQDLLLESEKEKNHLEELLIPISEKILIAVYIKVNSLDSEEVKQIMNKLSKKIKVRGFQFLFIPTTNQDTKIECVYPISSLSEENQKNINSKIETILKDNDGKQD